MAASSAYYRSVSWYGPSWIPGIFHKVVDDAVAQIRSSHTTLSKSAGDGEPVGENVVDADTAECVCVQSFKYSHDLGWDTD